MTKNPSDEREIKPRGSQNVRKTLSALAATERLQLERQREMIDRLAARLKRGESEGGVPDPMGVAALEVYAEELRQMTAVLDEQEALFLREVNLRDARPRLRVADFAAAGGEPGVDDGPALRSAIRAAGGMPGGAVVLLEPRSYSIRDFEDAGLCFHLILRGLRDVDVVCEEGEALLCCHQIGGAVLLEDCERIRLRGFGIDFDPLPFTQGRILAFDADEQRLTWRRDPGFGAPDKPPFDNLKRRVGKVCDPDTGAFTGWNFSVEESLAVDEDTWIFSGRPSAKSDHAAALVGQPLLLHSRGTAGAGSGIWLRHCRFVDCRNLAIHAAYHFGILVTDCSAVSFRQCRIGPRPGSSRLSCVNADGFHVSSNRFGPYLEDCEVLTTPDDCANFYVRMVSVCDVPEPDLVVLDALWNGEESPSKWALRKPDRRAFAIGDYLGFVETHSGRMLGVSRVKGVESSMRAGLSSLAIRLDRPVEGLISRHQLGLEDCVPLDQHFLKAPADQPLETFVVNFNTKSDAFALVGCHFHHNGVAGIKLKASNGAILDSHFNGHNWAAIDICMRLTWQEGFAPHDVLIAGNRIETAYPISANCEYPGGRRDIGPPYIHSIRIEDNDIVGSEWAVHLANTRDSFIRNNRLSAAQPLVIDPTSHTVLESGNLLSGMSNLSR